MQKAHYFCDINYYTIKQLIVDRKGLDIAPCPIVHAPKYATASITSAVFAFIGGVLPCVAFGFTVVLPFDVMRGWTSDTIRHQSLMRKIDRWALSIYETTSVKTTSVWELTEMLLKATVACRRECEGCPARGILRAMEIFFCK